MTPAWNPDEATEYANLIKALPGRTLPEPADLEEVKPFPPVAARRSTKTRAVAHHPEGEPSMTLNLTGHISAVLLKGSGWMSARNVEEVATDDWPAALRFESDGKFIVAPLSSVLGCQTRDQVQSAEELQARRDEEQRREDAAFTWTTWAPSRAAYNEAFTKTKGLCATCSKDLASEPLVHFSQGLLYCQTPRGLGCSPHQHRYGLPS